jgi:hypothetical protein
MYSYNFKVSVRFTLLLEALNTLYKLVSYFQSLLAEHKSSFQRFLGLEACTL